MSRKLNRQIKRMVFNQMDKMRILFKNEEEKFAVKRLPLVMVNNIIDLVKIKENSPIGEFKDFTKAFNLNLENLKNACLEQSEKIGDKAISYNEFKGFIDVIKLNFENGQNEARQLTNKKGNESSRI